MKSLKKNSSGINAEKITELFAAWVNVRESDDKYDLRRNSYVCHGHNSYEKSIFVWNIISECYFIGLPVEIAQQMIDVSGIKGEMTI